MARLAAGLVWAAVLRFLVLGVGLSRGSADLLGLISLLPDNTQVKISCKQDPSLYVAIRDNAVVLAKDDSSDKTQVWTVRTPDCRSFGKLTDDDGHKAFALVNACTGQVMVNKDVTSGDGEVHVQLARYDADKAGVQRSMLWTAGDDLGGGFREVRTFRDDYKTLNGLFGYVHDGTVVGIWPSAKDHDNAVWKITCTN